MRPCSRCGSHVKSASSTCPFCDSPIASGGATAAAFVLAGLALVGCEKKGSGPMPPVEPEYGVPISDSADGGAPPAADEGGAPPAAEGGAADDGSAPPVAEPEYGVADPG